MVNTVDGVSLGRIVLASEWGLHKEKPTAPEWERDKGSRRHTQRIVGSRPDKDIWRHRQRNV